MLSGGGEGPARFSKRETRRCLGPSLRKNMGGGPQNPSVWGVGQGETQPNRAHLFYVCGMCGCGCVCRYTRGGKGYRYRGQGQKRNEGATSTLPSCQLHPHPPLSHQVAAPRYSPANPRSKQGGGHQAFLGCSGTGASMLRRKAAPLSGFTGPWGTATWQQPCGPGLCTHRRTHITQFSVAGLVPATGAKQRQVTRMVDKNTQSHSHPQTHTRLHTQLQSVFDGHTDTYGTSRSVFLRHSYTMSLSYTQTGLALGKDSLSQPSDVRIS